MIDNPKSDMEKVKVINLGFRIKPIDSNETSKETENENSSESPQASFQYIGGQFTTKLLLLWTYMNEIGRVASDTRVTNMAGALALLVEIIDSAKTSPPSAKPLAEAEFRVIFESDEKKPTTFKLSGKVYEHQHLKVLMEHQRLHDAATRILYESALQQIVNAYERLIGDLIRWHLTYEPGEAPKDQSITYRELLQFGTMEEAQRKVIQSFLSEFLRTKTATQQLDYFREHFGCDLKANFPKMAEFEELVLRRHTIVHAGGVITPEYLRRVRSLGKLPFQPGQEGAIVELDKTYIESAWSTVYALGSILLHLIAKQCARDRKIKDEENQADNFVIMYPFKVIQEKVYDAAETILRYAMPLHLAKSTNNLIVTINLAQTLKWQDRDEEARALLEPIDWQATSNLFRACAAALRDPNQFGDLLTAAVRDKEIRLEDLYEWPVFTEIRKDSRFPDWIKQAFGGSDSPTTQRFAPSLLDFKRETTLTDLINLLDPKSGFKLERTTDISPDVDVQQNNGKTTVNATD